LESDSNQSLTFRDGGEAQRIVSTLGCTAILGITLHRYFLYPPLIPPAVKLIMAILMLTQHRGFSKGDDLHMIILSNEYVVLALVVYLTKIADQSVEIGYPSTSFGR
jgi:hypothetical protein